MNKNTLLDMAVIGAGPGGYHAAIRGSQLGLKVAVIEQDDGTGIGGLGGVCLNWGCIPSKSLLKNAELVNHMKHAEEWGIYFDNFSADMGKAVERSRKVSGQLTKGIGFLLKKNGIELIRGRGTLVTSTQVEVEGYGRVTAQNIVIAVGARAKSLPAFDLDGKTIISSREALELKEKPESIAIVGASAIGCEFAYYFNAYGSNVLLLEALDRIVPKEDAEISKELARRFKSYGISVESSATVKRVEYEEGKPVLVYEKDGSQKRFPCDKVLMGVGVQPNTDSLGLENLGIAAESGFIAVDGLMRTNVTGVYAIGDVTGKLPLAHVAFEQGIIAAEKIAGRNPSPIEDYSSMPRCTYCQPEIASIGLTESEAREKEMSVKVAKAPYQSAGKSVAIGEPNGFVKIVVDEDTGEIVGAHIIGAGATEMIAEIGMLRYLEGTHEELRRVTHAHPTLSEAVKEAGAAIGNSAIHF